MLPSLRAAPRSPLDALQDRNKNGSLKQATSASFASSSASAASAIPGGEKSFHTLKGLAGNVGVSRPFTAPASSSRSVRESASSDGKESAQTRRVFGRTTSPRKSPRHNVRAAAGHESARPSSSANTSNSNGSNSSTNKRSIESKSIDSKRIDSKGVDNSSRNSSNYTRGVANDNVSGGARINLNSGSSKKKSFGYAAKKPLSPSASDSDRKLIGSYHISDVRKVKSQFDFLDKERVGTLPFKQATNAYPELTLVDGVLEALEEGRAPLITFADVLKAVFSSCSKHELDLMYARVMPPTTTKYQVVQLREAFDLLDEKCTGYIDTAVMLERCNAIIPRHMAHVLQCSEWPLSSQPKISTLGKRICLRALFKWLFKATLSKADCDTVMEWGKPSKTLTEMQLEQLYHLYHMYDSSGEGVTLEDMRETWVRQGFSNDRKRALEAFFTKLLKESGQTVVTKKMFLSFYRPFTGYTWPGR